MKNLSVIIGCLIFLLNIVLFLILSFYPAFNFWLNSGIIAVSTLLLYLVSTIRLKDGFKVSFSCLFPVFSIVELVCGFCASDTLSDNPFVIAILILVIFQVIMLVIASFMSNNI